MKCLSNVRYCASHISFICCTLMTYGHYLQFKGTEIEAQRSEMTCPQPQLGRGSIFVY